MLFTATLVENRTLAAGGGRTSFVLRLGNCGALRGAKPGQFIMLRGEWGRDPLLPRAFSILRLGDDDTCELLLKAIGRGTRILEQTRVGAPFTVLGPLGTPFPAPERGRTDLLVAGGVGLAPLLWHAEVAHAAGLQTELFYGGRTAEDLVLLDEIERAGCRTHLTTEDGSKGTPGRVTAALEAHFAQGNLGPRPHVLTCGPNPMMRAVVELAHKHQVPSLVSVEGEMACGIGVCLGCAVPLTDGSKPFGYACTDGPVFDASRIVIP